MLADLYERTSTGRKTRGCSCRADTLDLGAGWLTFTRECELSARTPDVYCGEVDRFGWWLALPYAGTAQLVVGYGILYR